jgi:glycosyltransferase involved in cell wall biosynthesis
MRSSCYFFSPQPTPQTTNRYIINFYEKLSERVRVVNYNKKPVSASFDIFRYAFQSDVMILNWPEDVLHLRLGILQMFLSLISLVFFRIKGGIIVWICHNKDSHYKRFRLFRKFTRNFFTKLSQYIVVHSEDAIKHFTNAGRKVYFLNHPVYEKVPIKTENQDLDSIDVLIWGNITPYKGLTEFIESYKKNNVLFGVTIIGKANKEYLKQLTELAAGLNISIKDHFLSDEELSYYFENSKIILLPYLDNDTFSSGALIHSLNSSKLIIGPSVGNFIDLQKSGACLTYDTYNDLFSTINNLLNNKQVYHDKLSELLEGINKYYDSNSWDMFVENLLQIVSENNYQAKMVATTL